MSLKQRMRSLIDAALLYPIRQRYPGGVIVGAAFDAGIRLDATSGKAMLIRDCCFTMPDATFPARDEIGGIRMTGNRSS